ncbi:MAG TPA: hypothetical protein V6C65_35850, partial [Allocoleopsis sp.]
THSLAFAVALSSCFWERSYEQTEESPISRQDPWSYNPHWVCDHHSVHPKLDSRNSRHDDFLLHQPDRLLPVAAF